ncbi:MAG: hypothetical protein AAGG48_27200 [Planctomycetota bacterium]
MTKDQTETLIALVTDTKEDTLDCDGCFELMAEFVEYRLSNHQVPEALRAVERHLEQCLCCQDEYRALLDGLRAIAASSGD